MIKLFELPEKQNIKLYFDNKVIIFDHLDGLYSYCWLEEDKTKIVHINACTQLRKYKDGYKIKGVNMDNENIKEILDMLKDSQYIPSDDNRTYKLLDRDDTRHLLDYITNLQQLEQEHKKINGELREENSKLTIALQNIQEDYDRRIEENERLKEEKDNLYLDNTMLKMEKDIYKTGYEELKGLLSSLQNGSENNEES